MNEKSYDVIIAGGGPAGLTAALYTGRQRLKTLVVEKMICGGWTNITGIIENYPGFPEGVSGPDLSMKFKDQAERFGAEIKESEEIVTVEPSGEGVEIEIETSSYRYRCRNLIVATGSRVRKLAIPGEEEFTGKGVSYCATCDGPLYREKSVAVIGGGDAALEEAKFLTKFAKKLYLIHRRDEFRAAKILVEELEKDPKVEFILNSRPLSIEGKDYVKSLRIENTVTGETTGIDLDGIFIFIGVEPNSAFLKGVVELDEIGFVKTDESMRTSAAGIFAAGDVRSGNVRQVTAACGEATVAALAVRDRIWTLEGSSYGIS